jgi:hypothetical protein
MGDQLQTDMSLSPNTLYFVGFNFCDIKVKQFLGLQEVDVPRISRQSAHEGGKVISPTHRPPTH